MSDGDEAYRFLISFGVNALGIKSLIKLANNLRCSHYSVHEVDGKLFKLIECSTWPRLNVQVIDTTPDRFEDDLNVIKSRSLCGYSPHDKTFILKHAGGEGNGELNQSNVHEILNGMKEIMNAAVKWWMKNKNNI